ncbi:heme exporter protein CcmD [Vibrio gallicus]|uniref:heme exporter protein CcmD n=1 Tax=Vibrio gallicus TaxID=190897 RepID=UPI0021C2932F|nr:heme exporter protein CcmD [Vibrio gallicus]
MHFDSFSDFLAMGGYAGYVWSAFGITFGVMAFLFVFSQRSHTAILKEVRNKMDRQARVDAARDVENTL